MNNYWWGIYHRKRQPGWKGKNPGAWGKKTHFPATFPIIAIWVHIESENKQLSSHCQQLFSTFSTIWASANQTDYKHAAQNSSATQRSIFTYCCASVFRDNIYFNSIKENLNELVSNATITLQFFFFPPYASQTDDSSWLTAMTCACQPDTMLCHITCFEISPLRQHF